MIELGSRLQTQHKGVSLDLIANSEGSALVDQNPGILDLLVDIPANGFWDFLTGKARFGTRGFVIKEHVNFGGKEIDVAVKHFQFPDSDLDGQEQFEIMEALRELGFSCAIPLLASKERMISQWVLGPAPQLRKWHLEEQYDRYLGELHGAWEYLREKVVPYKKWELDGTEGNYRQTRDYNPNDPKTYFTAIDPVFVWRPGDKKPSTVR